jgi:hypothetical protein
MREFSSILRIMKYLLPLLVALFSFPVLGQGDAGNWVKLGPTVEGQRGFTLFGKGVRTAKAGHYELWVKIVPTSQTAFERQYSLPRGTAYAVQYASVDCDQRVLMVDKTGVFDRSDKPLPGRVNGLVSSQKNAVKPGSIGESIYRFVCVETTSLPMTTRNL